MLGIRVSTCSIYGGRGGQRRKEGGRKTGREGGKERERESGKDGGESG